MKNIRRLVPIFGFVIAVIVIGYADNFVQRADISTNLMIAARFILLGLGFLAFAIFLLVGFRQDEARKKGRR